MAFPPRSAYERLIYSLPERYPEIRSSTLHLYTNSPTTSFVRGNIRFRSGLELRVFEYVDFSDGELLDYYYAIFHGEDRIRWYDPQPHPQNPNLAETFPHHFHEPPNIKHNRQPAPAISFTEPNLPILIADCIALGDSPSSDNDRQPR